MFTTETVPMDSDLSNSLDKGSSGIKGKQWWDWGDSDLSSWLDKQSSGQHDYTYVPEETVSSSITSYI